MTRPLSSHRLRGLCWLALTISLAIFLLWRFGAQWTAAASVLLGGLLYRAEHWVGRCVMEAAVPRFVPYLTPVRKSRRTGQRVYQFTIGQNQTGEFAMNVAQLIAAAISQGLSKIPNQSPQTQADAQAMASAMGAFLTDLARDELLHELQSLPLASLVQKIPQLAAYVKGI